MAEPNQMERMAPELREHLIERLSHRADRLAKVTAVGHPGRHIDAVVAMMASQVARTAMVLLGETFARDVWEHLFDGLAEASGICRFCRARPLRSDKTMCQVCWDTAASNDDITDDELSAVAREASQ